MAKDPVCGMHLTEASAAAKSNYNGKTYCFCSTACKTVFDKNPEKYVAK
jgi:YHS domain-containing protein